MKNFIILSGGLLLVFTFFFFDNPLESEPSILGYVVESDFMRLLAVNGITEEQVTSISEEKLLQLNNVSAIWVSKCNIFQFRKGQKVKVWISSGVQESFPAQAKADSIEVIGK